MLREFQQKAYNLFRKPKPNSTNLEDLNLFGVGKPIPIKGIVEKLLTENCEAYQRESAELYRRARFNLEQYHEAKAGRLGSGDPHIWGEEWLYVCGRDQAAYARDAALASKEARDQLFAFLNYQKYIRRTEIV